MAKKILIAIFSVSCIFLFLFIRGALLPKEEIVYDQFNKTFVVKGDVKIKKAKGKAGWQKMDASTVLEKGDIVETAEGSTADIVIGRETDKTIKVEEKSRVEFQEVNPTSLKLSRGKLLTALKKLEPKSSFVIKTPTAICGARGTGWSEEASEDKTRICVFENSVYTQEIGANGKPNRERYIINEGTQRALLKGKPISEVQAIGEYDLEGWKYWINGVAFFREGKILVDDFDRKENLNNLGGTFGSWNVFYSDPNQYCKDEFTAAEKMGDKGYSLKLAYDVDTSFSAYNGFFTNLMGIDISDYKYLVFFIKGDKDAGFTTKVNIELKNNAQTGRATLEGITDEWKKMVIPLGRFKGINYFTKMKEFVIVFSDINVTKKEGVIYIDDIYFSKAEPD